MQSFQSSRDTYDVIRLLGEGGMGHAYLVKSRQTGEQYCLKQLRLDRAGEWKAVELFEREAKILAQLKHPSIPEYVDSFQSADGAGFVLVQSFIDGETLQQRIEQKRPVTLEEFLSYFKQALEVLVYLHSLIPPVVHRDITPKNLILSNGRLHLVDFGAVKVALGPSTSMTSVGTFGYMSPEQLLGQAGPASDIYSLGMSLISLAALTDPSKMPLDQGTGRVDVASLVSFLPSHMRLLLQDMVRLGVGERVASAKIALDRLQNPTATLQVQYQGQAATPPKVESSQSQRDESKKKRRRVFGIIAGLLMTILLLGWISTLQRARGEVRTLGGWFTGHSHLLSAITGTLTGDYSLLVGRAWVKGVAYSANGKIASSADNNILLWDANTGSVLKEFATKEFDRPEKLAFTPDNQWLVTVTEKRAYLFSVESSQEATVIELDVFLYQQWKAEYLDVLAVVALSKEQVLAAFSHKGETLIVDVIQRRLISKLTHPEVYMNKPSSFSRDGESFALGCDQEAYFWLLDAGEMQSTPRRILKAPKEIESLALNDDATLLAGITDMSGTIWDLTSGTTKQDFPARWDGYSFNPYPMEFSRDSRLLAVAHGEQLYFFGVESGARLEKYDAHHDEIQSVAFSPDGSTVTTAASDQLIKLWQAPTGK